MDTLTLAQVSKLTEAESRDYLESIRWPNGPVCPHCLTVNNATKMQGKSTRPGVYKCKVKDCRKPFTVTVGTIFADSHIDLRLWLMAFWLMCGSKKGFSALQLQRTLGLKSYQSAWHMAHRIRHAMKEGPLADLLKGTVEVDETYVGGRRRRKHETLSQHAARKIPIMALVERDGRARAFPIERLTSKNLQLGLLKNVHQSARIMTDDHNAYPAAALGFEGGHHTVNHSRGEYVRGDVTTNTVESFFALIKRGVYGNFHHISRPHLSRYVDEFVFRHNTRKLKDGQRALIALQQVGGKRLQYKLATKRA